MKEGFKEGGATLHSMMTPHGPDYECYKFGSEDDLKPVREDFCWIILRYTYKIGIKNNIFSTTLC